MLRAQASFRLAGLKSLRDGRRQSRALRSAVSDISGYCTQFTLRRFRVFSLGGGDWPPIKPETARRKKSKRILFATGDLEKGLKLGLWQRVSWSGPWMTLTVSMRARRRHGPSGLPIQELVKIHQRGLGRVPRRPVLVRPDRATQARATHRLVRALAKR